MLAGSNESPFMPTGLVKAGIPNQDRFLDSDVARLPVESASFSEVTLSFTLEQFDPHKIPLVLEECRRELTPGGCLGVVSMLKTEPPSKITE